MRKPKIHGWVNDDRINVKLYSHETTKDVYWSPRWDGGAGGGHGGLNSYVLAEPGRRPTQSFETAGGAAMLVCVNGVGEVRWVVSPNSLENFIEYAIEHEPDYVPSDRAEELMAAHHFGIV